MKRVIIIGGVSCDPDDKEHDRNPYNFINPAVKLCKKLTGGAIVMMHAKSYENRAKNYPPEKEHPWVGGLDMRKKLQSQPDHFYQTVANRCTDVVAIDSADDLTKELQKVGQIRSIHYFGHSSMNAFFLRYRTSHGKNAEVTWGSEDAAKIKDHVFDQAFSRWTLYKEKTEPYVCSFGCYQGKVGGLCEYLRKAWNIKAIGANEQTGYKTIGANDSYPSGDYYAFDNPLVNVPSVPSYTNRRKALPTELMQ